MTSPIRRSRLADQAYELLKERILTRQLLPGARLSVPAIADELGLSRSPVREAVQRLVQEGLGAERPHSGAVVATADLPALIDLYQVRAELESLSCRLAAEADDDALVPDLGRIQAAHEAAHDAGDRARMIRADVDFHERIARAAANPELTRMLRPVLQQMLLGMREADRDWPVHAVAEHRAIIAALGVRDVEESGRRMRAHVLRVRGAMQDKVREQAARSAVDPSEAL